MGLAAITFLLNFVFKRSKSDNADAKEEKNVKMKASHNENSTINQSAGDMTINISQKDEFRR